MSGHVLLNTWDCHLDRMENMCSLSYECILILYWYILIVTMGGYNHLSISACVIYSFTCLIAFKWIGVLYTLFPKVARLSLSTLIGNSYSVSSFGPMVKRKWKEKGKWKISNYLFATPSSKQCFAVSFPIYTWNCMKINKLVFVLFPKFFYYIS